jgi:hypothetical protein
MGPYYSGKQYGRIEMRVQQQVSNKHAVCALAVVLLVLLAVVPAQAAVNWDAGWDGTPEDTTYTHWWYETVGWTEDGAQRVPPVAVTGTGTPEDPYVYSASSSSDALINGSGPWDQGEGVVYDPANDPSFASTSAMAYWSLPAVQPYTPQTIWRLYIARYPAAAPGTADTKLTIKGDMTTSTGPVAAPLGDTRWQIGRSSGTQGVPATGIIVQEGGTVINGYGDVDLGSSDTSPGSGYFGNGTYDYRSGTFEQGLLDESATRRFRLAAGGSTAAGGIGELIMHNPDTAGHFRVKEMLVASYGGGGSYNPDGMVRGVGIAEFHYDNAGTRPVQVNDNLTIANGQNTTGTQLTAWRSSRLRLVLDEAPTVDVNGVPINLGLFDVDSDGNEVGVIMGPGGTASSLGVTFSDANAIDADSDPLASHNAAYVYDEGDIVTAMFGASTYRWNIHYTGDIAWTDRDAGTLSAVTWDEENPGRDIVLIGLDSVIIEGLYGDYNDDGIVDAADYTVWRDNLGGVIPNDPTGGVATEADYDYWKAHFGETAPGAGALAGAAVPEPSTLVLAIFVAVLWIGRGVVTRR